MHFAVRTFTVPEIRDWVIGAGFSAFDALGSRGRALRDRQRPRWSSSRLPGMRYFAYGSNMDPVQMAERAPGGRALGAARLAGWRLTFTRDSPAWGGGVGHIEPDEADEVWGVLWDRPKPT